ncbi:MAG: hypothetical protein KKA79_09075 [Nanoarchaeota archaeon]|nr:hypothetical protein [Nanoarchaeota archaeon]
MKIKKILSLASLCAAVTLASGCNSRDFTKEESSIKTSGMPAYSDRARLSNQIDSNVTEYMNDFAFAESDKEGFKPRNSLDGDITFLTTNQCFYGEFVKKLGLDVEESVDENGKKWYSMPTSHLVKLKVLQPLEHLKSPGVEYYGNTLVIEYDLGVDQKPDLRLTVYEDIATSEVTQELDIGADGTIEEVLVFNSYYDKVVSYQKSPNFPSVDPPEN